MKWPKWFCDLMRKMHHALADLHVAKAKVWFNRKHGLRS
jgi:hypothetical protein